MQTSAWNSNMCVFIYSNVRFVALHVYFYYCCNMSAKITALLSKSLMNIECWDENNFLDLSWHEAHERVQGERQICVINTKSNLGCDFECLSRIENPIFSTSWRWFYQNFYSHQTKKFQGPRDQATFYDSQIIFECMTNAITRDFWLHVQQLSLSLDCISHWNSFDKSRLNVVEHINVIKVF